MGFAGMELKVLHWAGEIGDGTGQGGDWAIGDWAIGRFERLGDWAIERLGDWAIERLSDWACPNN